MMLSCFFFNSAGTYDVITVGAFTAGALKYRHGGLRRMIQQLEQRSSRVGKDKTGHAALVEVMTEMDVLQNSTNAACDKACTAAVQGKADLLIAAMTELENYVSGNQKSARGTEKLAKCSAFFSICTTGYIVLKPCLGTQLDEFWGCQFLCVIAMLKLKFSLVCLFLMHGA